MHHSTTLMCHCEERSDVAISGRHCRPVPAVVKTANAEVWGVAAVTAQPLAALPPYGCGVPLTGSDRPVWGEFNRIRALVRRAPP